MRRLISIFIALLYLVASSGFTLHTHYCMGRKTSAGLLDQRGSGHTCSRCGMEQKDGNSCCRDEYKVFKSNPDQSVAPALILAFTGLVAEMPPAREFPAGDSRPLLSAIKLPPAHGPPLPPGCPVYLRVRNLRI